jgi:hypothetical protein
MHSCVIFVYESTLMWKGLLINMLITLTTIQILQFFIGLHKV